jgi:hypothetical protein
MSPHAYSEDQFVEQPAIGLCSALGWQTVSAPAERWGARPEARWYCCRACFPGRLRSTRIPRQFPIRLPARGSDISTNLFIY